LSGSGDIPRFGTLLFGFPHSDFQELDFGNRLGGPEGKEKITQDLVEMLMNWRHSGFNVFCGPRIQPNDETAMASGS
jgi:hypothetical protein